MKLYKNTLVSFLAFMVLACSNDDNGLNRESDLLLKKVTQSISSFDEDVVTTYTYEDNKPIKIHRYLGKNSDELSEEIIYDNDKPVRVSYYQNDELFKYALISYNDENISEVNVYSVEDKHLSYSVFSYVDNKLFKQETYGKSYDSDDFVLYNIISYTHSFNNIKTIDSENLYGLNTPAKRSINLTLDDKNHFYKNANFYYKILSARNDYGVNSNNVLTETFEIDNNPQSVYTYRYQYEYNEFNFPTTARKYDSQGVLVSTILFEY